MSKFIKRHEEIAQAQRQARAARRGGGFTEAELEAAQWARKLPEVQLQICRRTNGDLRDVRMGMATRQAIPVEEAEPKAAKGQKNARKGLRKEKLRKKRKDGRAEEEQMEGRGTEVKEAKAKDAAKAQGDLEKEGEGAGVDAQLAEETARRVQLAVNAIFAAPEKDKKERKEKKQRKEKKEEKKDKKEKKENKEKKEKDKLEKKEKKAKKEKEKRDGLEREKAMVSTKVIENFQTPEPGSLEEKALEMKLKRRLARQMRREQRRLKREERERRREERAELMEIDELIEAAQNEAQEASPEALPEAPEAPEALEPAAPEEEPAPFRSLEQLVKELDELERLKKLEKAKKLGTAAAAAAGEAGGEAVGPAPYDPMNPLNAAYDMKAYELLRKLRLDEEHQISQIALDEPDWDHLGYLRRSPSPCRLRTKGTMWPTRKGAWRSRAGGVYLPPELRPLREGSASPSPARWMYPEEFNRPLQKARRSPSYERFEREISSSSSSSTSRKKRRRSSSSSSRETRPSPTYQPDE